MDVDVVAPVRIEYEGKRPLDEGQLDRPPLPSLTSPLSSPFKRLKGMSDGEDEPLAENERAQAAPPFTSPLTPTATPPMRRSAILAVRGTKVGFNETSLFLEQQASTAALLARFHAEVGTEAPRMPDAYLPLVANLVQDRSAPLDVVAGEIAPLLFPREILPDGSLVRISPEAFTVVRNAIECAASRVNYGLDDDPSLCIWRWEMRSVSHLAAATSEAVLHRRQQRLDAQAALAERLPDLRERLSARARRRTATLPLAPLPSSTDEPAAAALSQPSEPSAAPPSSSSSPPPPPLPLAMPNLNNEKKDAALSERAREKEERRLKREREHEEQAERERQRKAEAAQQGRIMRGFFVRQEPPAARENEPHYPPAALPDHSTVSAAFAARFPPFFRKPTVTVAPLFSAPPRPSADIDAAIHAGIPPGQDALSWARRVGQQRRAATAAAARAAQPPHVAALPAALATRRFKLLQFALSRRPPFYGTFGQSSRIIGPRRPLVKDEGLLDYEVDSDAEWEEEEEEGESLSSDEEMNDEEEAEGDEADDCGFVVPNGYLSDDEVMDDDDEGRDAEGKAARKRQAIEDAARRAKIDQLVPVIEGPFWENAVERTAPSAFLAELTIRVDEAAAQRAFSCRAAALSSPPLPSSVTAPLGAAADDTAAAAQRHRGATIADDALPKLVRMLHGSTNSLQKLADAVAEQFAVAKQYAYRKVKEVAEKKRCAGDVARWVVFPALRVHLDADALTAEATWMPWSVDGAALPAPAAALPAPAAAASVSPQRDADGSPSPRKRPASKNIRVLFEKMSAATQRSGPPSSDPLMPEEALDDAME